MRILIVKLSSIGDVVHTLPAASLLRKHFSDARISWVVDPRASALLENSPVIDEVIQLNTRTLRKGLLNGSPNSELKAQLQKLRNGTTSNGFARSDIAIDFQGLIKSGLVAFSSGASRRIGFCAKDLRERASQMFLTEQVDTTQRTHVIEKNLALAQAAIDSTVQPQNDIPPVDRYEFPIRISDDDEKFVDAAVRTSNPFAIINPGGGWPTKLWPTERYAELADWLWNDCRLATLVTFGPGEEPLALAIASQARSGKVRSQASTLKQFVALARRAALFVGGDTGPLHLAAASGTPIVSLFGPTSPDRNGPFDPRDISVGRDLWCRSDCHRRSCWHWECMDISVNDVKQAVLRRLADQKRHTEKAD
ncbi:MAG TPA: glycosyltransferase family 9 protein [Blastocatellia bacterium]|nr:glycosyltransferase family 9 protein [Blastocatellia bacterium]